MHSAARKASTHTVQPSSERLGTLILMSPQTPGSLPQTASTLYAMVRPITAATKHTVNESRNDRFTVHDLLCQVDDLFGPLVRSRFIPKRALGVTRPVADGVGSQMYEHVAVGPERHVQGL